MIQPKIDKVLERYNSDCSQVISILQDIQAKEYYLSEEALGYLSKKMEIPLSKLYAIATFYRAFSLKKRGRHFINVCLGTACHVRGAARILEEIERELKIRSGETTGDFKFTLETVNCLGACALGPIIVVDGEYHGKMSASKVRPILDRYEKS